MQNKDINKDTWYICTEPDCGNITQNIYLAIHHAREKQHNHKRAESTKVEIVKFNPDELDMANDQNNGKET